MEKKFRQEKRKKLNKENKHVVTKVSKASQKNAASVIADNDKTNHMYCEIQYCQSSVDWVRCKTCKQCVCTDCAHLSTKNKAFRPICDNCK